MSTNETIQIPAPSYGEKWGGSVLDEEMMREIQAKGLIMLPVECDGQRGAVVWLNITTADSVKITIDVETPAGTPTMAVKAYDFAGRCRVLGLGAISEQNLLKQGHHYSRYEEIMRVSLSKDVPFSVTTLPML